jgi:hypothetical protein
VYGEQTSCEGNKIPKPKEKEKKKKIKNFKNHSIISDFLSFSFSKGPG